MKPLLIILSFAAMSTLQGCAHVADRYSPSADGVEAARRYQGTPINVGTFKTAQGVAATEVSCAAAGIVLADGVSFADYIRSALVADLKMAGAYSAASPITITGKIERLEVDVSVLSMMGEWQITLTVSGPTHSFAVSENYQFQAQSMTMTRCDGSARRFNSAVQNLVAKVLASPEFMSMVREQK